MIPEVGQAAEAVRTVTAQDIDAFAAVSGDHNPVHTTGDRIAHGMLSAGFVSALIGNVLPGPGSVYISQSLKFRRAVKPGDEVTTRVEVTAVEPRRGWVTLKTVCSVGGKACLDGEAVVVAPR